MRHKHKWVLRADGKYECDCGMILTGKDLYFVKSLRGYPSRNSSHWLLLGDFWHLIEVQREKALTQIARCGLPLPVHIVIDRGGLRIEEFQARKEVIRRIICQEFDEDGFLHLEVHYVPQELIGV